VPIGFIDGQLRKAKDGDTADLPRGDVTFLRTDIEGSTDLVRRLDGRYGPLLDQVRSIIRRAVREAHGYEVDCRADEFFAAFRTAPEALAAAIEMERRIAEASWPDGAEVRIRIGLHSGRPTLRRTGYIGLDVPTVARICAAGHGGQILASSAAYQALTAALPDGVKLRSLGSHRLRGLPEPAKLYQVEAEGLRTKFPPLRRDVDVADRMSERQVGTWESAWMRARVTGH
jgi:class 3 adenylate cyclase